MQITRGIRPERNFAIISNYVLRDSALSYRARGVLCCILSFAEGFQISSDRLAEMGKEGRDAIRSALSELEAAGYLKRTKEQDEKGLWSSSAVINDVPDLSIRKLPVPVSDAPEIAPAPAPVEPETGFQASDDRSLKNRQSDSQALKEDQKEDKKKKEAPAPVIPKISFDGKKFQDLSEDQIALWTEAYPAISIAAEVLKAAVWLDANPANKKSDYKKFLNGWLCRAQDKAPRAQDGARTAKPRSSPTNTHKFAGAVAAIWSDDDSNDSRTVNA